MLMGRKQPMINALARLGGLEPGALPQGMQALGITGSLGKTVLPPIRPSRSASRRCRRSDSGLSWRSRRRALACRLVDNPIQ
jgi:hypothetical protein